MKKLIAFGVVLGMLSLNIYATDMLIPMGQTAGIKILCDGSMVSGITKIQTKDGPRYPTKDAGIQVGDILKTIDGVVVASNEQLAQVIHQTQGRTVEVTFQRDGKLIKENITPALDSSDNMYKLGLWVRDSLAGIGTITYINPEDQSYGALGHSISEIDSGKIMPVKQGELVESSVKGVQKGKSGTPGQLQGEFNLTNEIGTIYQNNESGIYGYVDANISENLTPIPIGSLDDVKQGSAYILSNIEGKNVEQYDIEILKIQDHPNDLKNFIIRITDERLLEKTGGIVQGMSGSPIIQDGKIIGAVTHVLVNNPREGYGIGIENMLEAVS